MYRKYALQIMTILHVMTYAMNYCLDVLINMTEAIDNVGSSRQLYIIICMNVPKHLQFVQKNAFMMCTSD